MARPQVSESKAALKLEQRLNETLVINGEVSSDERIHTEGNLRYNSSCHNLLHVSKLYKEIMFILVTR